jgi:Flp pilus assembly protein TadG
MVKEMRLKSETGQALIETALTLPLLCLILLGAVEFARAVYAAIEVSNAASAAVQYGASGHGPAGDWSVSGSTYSGGIVNAAVNDAANLTGSNAITVTSISTSCKCADPSAPAPTSCSDNKTCVNSNTAMVETLTVKTKATYHPLISYFGLGNSGFFFGPNAFTLYGQASQVVSNQ